MSQASQSTPGMFFQAAIKFVQSHLNGTIRLIVFPGSPRRCSAPTGTPFCAYPVIDIGARGVSFKMRKRRETGKDGTKRWQRRRAAQRHQSSPCFALHGYSREPVRPPHLLLIADHRATISSFLYFERAPRGPSESTWSSIAVLREHPRGVLAQLSLARHS
jgi:hypothetical protein